jgi:hypothetical protein
VVLARWAVETSGSQCAEETRQTGLVSKRDSQTHQDDMDLQESTWIDGSHVCAAHFTTLRRPRVESATLLPNLRSTPCWRFYK